MRGRRKTTEQEQEDQEERARGPAPGPWRAERSVTGRYWIILDANGCIIGESTSKSNAGLFAASWAMHAAASLLADTLPPRAEGG